MTRKRASAEAARSLLADVRRAAPGAGAAVAHLAPGNVVEWGSGTVEAVSSLEGRRVLAVSGIGDPAAFRAQLEDAGARADALSYGDHHRFTAVDAAEIVRRGAGFDRVVCTLKDAVKLGAHWPREAPPMWYLSLRVTLEGAADDFERLIARFARPPLT